VNTSRLREWIVIVCYELCHNFAIGPATVMNRLRLFHLAKKCSAHATEVDVATSRKAVADLIVALEQKQLESHRQEITALFCDLRGFTGFSESLDPEDVMAILAEYHAAIGEIIIKYSGTRYAGDGVMVIFDDPVPVDNPAPQAVLMALDMRAAISGLIEKWFGQFVGLLIA
jgi:class 3 adenylate cyclase